ncbi:AAA family ATPase [Streptococcus sp. NLN64]|uniref:AAA family ATPase n=1 Tax=Streptococcus sp. NLN64 TaxID=2822799 RepID=UPI0018CBDFF8|nr:AAA family ATPase [Streptococcus sp. NLN64]MBG9367706.1 AAA family ATPase [Streptococcus sp. NLN64]
MTPFTTIFGKSPKVFLNRNQEFENLLKNLNNPYSDAQSTIITGVRGSGKTTFITKLENELPEHWIPITLINTPSIVSELIAELSNKVNREITLSNSIQVKNFSVLGLTIENVQSQNTTNQQQLIDLLTICQNANRKVVVLIDEISSSNGIRELYSLFQLLIRKDLPISIVSTGLPEDINEVITDKILTFLLRSNIIELSPLTIDDIEEAYIKHLSLDRSVAGYAAEKTKGYAYAFQLLGQLMYEKESTTINDIDEIIPDFRYLLGKNAYRLIKQRLSEKDEIFLKAIKSETKIADLITETKWDKNLINTYKYRLIDKGLVFQPQRGYVDLVLPEFDIFLENF